MRYADASAFRQAIEQRIKIDALGDDAKTARRRKRIAFDRMLARLVAIAPSKWVLKGGFALDLRIPDGARATRDVDIAWHHHESELIDVLLDATDFDAGDFFEFAIERTDELAGLDARTHRFKVTASLAGRVFETFPLDVGIRSIEPPDTESLSAGDQLQFADIEPFEIPVLPLELHVAEKLHAYTRDYGDGRSNSRVKDLVDLALISTHFTLNEDALAEAIRSTFAERGSHDPPRSMPSPNNEWRVHYGSLARSVGLHPDISTGFAQSATLLNPVLAKL